MGTTPTRRIVIPAHRALTELREELARGGLPAMAIRTPEDSARIASFRVVVELLRLLHAFRLRVECGERCHLVEREHAWEPGRLLVEIAIEPLNSRFAIR